MGSSFEIEQWVDASMLEVFEHFTVAAKLVRWHGVEAEVDARPGGAWWCRFEDGSIVRGEFLELDPPHRLVFTWGFEVASPQRRSLTAAGSSRVEVTLHPEGEATRVVLRHSAFASEDDVATGWRHFLIKLSLDLR